MQKSNSGMGARNPFTKKSVMFGTLENSPGRQKGQTLTYQTSSDQSSTNRAFGEMKKETLASEV